MQLGKPTIMRERESILSQRRLKLGKSIWTPFLATLILVISGCQTVPVPQIKIYTEIPFLDCPEGVWVETVTQKTGTVNCKDWTKMKPFMIMLDTEGKKVVFEKWEETCRFNPNSCNVTLSSVKSTVEALDKIAGSILK
jgi:hypothetical protein